MSITSQSTPVQLTDILFLREVNILKLQSAARMAGLRWKSGTPGYDKQGIIDKLAETPSMLRATVAAVRRMGGESAPAELNPFLDDIAEEMKAQTPVPGASADGNALHDLTLRVESIERTAPLETRRIAQRAESAAKAANQNVIDLTARICKLEARTPTDIHFPALPPIKLDGTEHRSYKKLLAYLFVNRRVILTGSAGTGKSMAVKNAAEHFGLPFHLQPPVTMPHEYLGHCDAQGVFHETPTFQAYTKGGLLLLDEADASLPDALLAANPIFDGNGFATFGDGRMYTQSPDFMAVFNMNTDGNGSTMQYSGRNRLDGATLARFGVRINWAVDAVIERQMALGNTAWYECVLAVRAFITQRQIVDVNATPRHLKTGAALLAANCATRKEILTDVLRSGALSECWAEVLRLPAVRSFLQD
jgi:MoxR-like ATPase